MRFLIVLAVIASMWQKNPTDTAQSGYRVIQAEGKTVHMAPISAYYAAGNEDHYRRLHHHGVALESSLMAYRIYFDKKQTIDVYCKRRPGYELLSSFWYPSRLQINSHFGNDILRVHGYIGVGTLKPYDFAQRKMVHFDRVDYRYQTIVEQGAQRGVMEMRDYGWRNGDQRVDTITTRYTLLSDHRDMMVEGFTSVPVANLCTGVQFMPDGSYIAERTANGGVILGSYGTDWPQNDSATYAKETVGLGVYIPAEYVADTVTDAHNNLCLLREGKYVRYYMVVCGVTMEDKPVAKNSKQWYAYLRKWAKKLEKEQ